MYRCGGGSAFVSKHDFLMSLTPPFILEKHRSTEDFQMVLIPRSRQVATARNGQKMEVFRVSCLLVGKHTFLTTSWNVRYWKSTVSDDLEFEGPVQMVVAVGGWS